MEGRMDGWKNPVLLDPSGRGWGSNKGKIQGNQTYIRDNKLSLKQRRASTPYLRHPSFFLSPLSMNSCILLSNTHIKGWFELDK